MSDHHSESPSSLSNYERCCWYEKDKAASSEAAERGTFLHKCVEDNAPERIVDDDDRTEVLKCLFILQTLRQRYPGYIEYKECRIEGVLNHGTVDRMFLSPDKTHLVIVDWKFGREPITKTEDNLQGGNYMLNAFDTWPQLQSVTVIFVQFGKEDEHTFLKKDVGPMVNRIKGVIERRQNKELYEETMDNRVCTYCARKAKCKAFNAVVTTSAMSIYGIGLSNNLMLGTPKTADEMVSLYILANLLANDDGWCRQIKQEIIHAAQGDPKTMQELSDRGLRYVNRKGSWSVLDHGFAVEWLMNNGASPELIAKHSKVNVVKCVEELASANSMFNAAEMMDTLQKLGICKQGESSGYFKRSYKGTEVQQLREMNK